jgi:hypothetical protein
LQQLIYRTLSSVPDSIESSSHARSLARAREKRERERERESQSNETETPTTHCWTIIPAIQVSSIFSSILLVYVFILLYLFVGYCRPSFIQIFIHPSAICLNVLGYFCKTLPSKFHQISSIFCLCLKFILILLQDIANQVSSKISSIFFLCNNLLRSLYWTMPPKFHPYFIHPLAFMSLNLENFARQWHPSFIQVFQCIVFLLSICSKIFARQTPSKFIQISFILLVMYQFTQRDILLDNNVIQSFIPYSLICHNLNRDIFLHCSLCLDDADSSIYLLADDLLFLFPPYIHLY